MDVSVYIIAFNNPTYVEFMVTQLQKFKIKKIVIVDNNSSYPPLLEYYQVNKDKFQLIRMEENYGHKVVIECFYDFLPDFFIITDPDLQFNPNLPEDFIEELKNLSIKYSAYKVGFALDISDAKLFNPKMKLCNKSIREWESRFWRKKINDPKYELYDAEIDTTFALYNKKLYTGNNLKAIRVAGNFVCKHLPWYLDEKIPEDEMKFYLETKKTGDWIKRSYVLGKPNKKYLIISPQTSLEQKIKVLVAGMLLAKQTGRIPVHCWDDYDKYFQSSENIPHVSKLGVDKMDLVLTEWLPGEFWYEKQSGGQKKFKFDFRKKIRENGDILLEIDNVNLEYIMLETSLIPKITKYSDNFSIDFDQILKDLNSISKSIDPMSTKYLIISPQAGLCNRLRALCSGILVAKQTGRIPLHCWYPESGTSNIPNVQEIKKLGFSDFFEPTEKLKLTTPNEISLVDQVLTEWIPGDYWYTFQNTAQQRWSTVHRTKVNENLNILTTNMNNDKVILLESSLSVKLDSDKDDNFKNQLGKIYEEYFKPQKRFMDMLDTLPDIDIGFSIRRGDLLQYFPEARQEPNAILEWMFKLLKISDAKNICIFSEDHKFIAEFKNKLLERIQINIITLQNNIASWEMGYLEFLVLGIKCKKIYGTPKSSFAEEAGLFRSKFHYDTILTPINEDIKLDLVKDVLPKVTIAILCKNKAHLLSIYLKCIYNLYYPKSLINLYVRTNDNNDKSADILKIWLNNVKNEYNEIFYDESSVNKNIMKYGNHEWNPERFSVLGKIRQDSILYAKDKGTDYFVIDCDNFVKAHTLMHLVQTQKSVIGPYLRLISTGSSISMYSNFHADISKEGYHIENENYNKIWAQSDPGIHKVNVIHCTYYIKNKVLDNVNYFDNTKHHEYVIFSRNLRKAGIDQFIDNTQIYGYLTFEDTSEEFWKKFSLDLMKQLLL